ncbi:MAG TPA: hypothetical protein DIC60_10310 [Lachnospiraceae bacterium]|nr:hypothetical protein [Lachnospiraceae bacterium]
MKDEKNKSLLKYGGYASAMTAVVVIVAIVLNMVASQLNIKFDLTNNKLYSISEDTVTLLQGLTEDVNIYSVYADGEEMPIVTEILDKYASSSKHITVENVDPYKNPQFTAKYVENGEPVSVGSVVVSSAKGYKIISESDLADVYVNQSTGESYMQGIKLESVLTGVIRSLTSGESNAIYALTGHNEVTVCDGLRTELEYGGYSLKDLNLLTETKIPTDCNILLINAPTTDITDSESKLIREYMDNGGSVFITLAIVLDKMPNLDSLLANYGVSDSKKMVIEGNADYVYQQNPYYIVPQLSAENPISARLSETKTSAFIPFSVAIDTLDVVRSTVKISSFVATSPYAYSKALDKMSSYEKEETDQEGPFNLGVAITDTDKAGNEAGVKLVVFGAETVMENDINAIVNGGNFGLVMNAFDWLMGKDTLSRSKSLGVEDYLQLTQSKAIAIMCVSVILIPLIILMAGLAVVIRRKNR